MIRSLRILVLVLLTALLATLGGCIAYDEAKSNLDLVIGPGYTPPVDREANFTPKRLLLLPVSGHLDDRYKREFVNAFRSELNDNESWTVVDWPDGSLGPSKLEIQRPQAYEMAQRLNCDGILYVRLEDSSIYPPLRLAVRYAVEEVATGQVAVHAFQDYDTSNKRVANSARSYYQTSLSRHVSPEKSLIILSSNPPFLKYAAFTSANSLKKTMEESRAVRTSAETKSH